MNGIGLSRKSRLTRNRLRYWGALALTAMTLIAFWVACFLFSIAAFNFLFMIGRAF